MSTLSYVLLIMILFTMVMLLISAWVFFRKMYYMFEEIDARMIQVRNIVEELKVLVEHGPKPEANH